jgi:hypothetical protein
MEEEFQRLMRAEQKIKRKKPHYSSFRKLKKQEKQI